MGAPSQAETSHRRWTETGLGRGLLFLGIVWSISGGFLVFQNGGIALLAWAIGHGLIPVELAARKVQPQPVAAHCAGPGTTAMADPAALQRARHAAFRLGQDFGLAAGAAFSGLGSLADRIGPLLQEVRAQAGLLSVPAPELPRIRHAAAALIEFADHLARDPDCTAARLAARYAPAHAEAYRFGAVVGYAALYCLNDVCGANGAEIRHYGQAAGVPDWIWRPMATGSLAGVPGADAREKTFRVLATLEEHFRTGR